jgi:hypothetical protein
MKGGDQIPICSQEKYGSQKNAGTGGVYQCFM